MYKAIREIGGYKVGAEVPEEKAEIWMQMYLIPQVEKVAEEKKVAVVEKPQPVKEEVKPVISNQPKKIKDSRR